MGKKLLVGVAVLSFALLGSAFAEVENIKVSGDIATEAVMRDFSLGSPDHNDDHFLFSQIRLRIDADLTENVSAVIRLINERLWGSENNEADSGTNIALDLGYVQLGEFLYEPLTLIVGRQNLRYGSALIVGDPDTNQTAAAGVDTEVKVPAVISDLSLRKSFDAIRAILDYSPYTLDIIFAKVSEGITNSSDDVTLAGANLAYAWGSYNGVTEGYFFSANRGGGAERQETYTVGARTQFDPTDNLTLAAEGAYQFGEDTATAHRDVSAFAVSLDSEYRFLNDYNAKVGLSYAYLSGDDDMGNDANNAWDPLFEDQALAEIINILFTNSNTQAIKLTGSYMPREDITLGMVYVRAWLAENLTTTAALPTFKPTVGPASGQTYRVDRNEKDIGDEIDVYAVYDYTEDVQLKLTGAYFIPGSLFTHDNDSTAYSVRGGVSVSF
ncbi:MAG: alginate export family protein [Candidatus Omnitrophica bacterium]|nr:alginate export family protein [Candidatus Omnitrophota bacterium]